MEKFSNATQDFFKTIDTEKKKLEKDPDLIKDVVKTLKVVSNPSDLPRKALAFGVSKLASQEISEDIKVLELRDFLIGKYGSEWISWIPSVIRKTLFKDERNTIIENKIQALATCLSTDTPWLEWHIFENVGKAFNHQVPNFGQIQPLTPGECAVTMRIMNNLVDPDNKYSNEVLIYVASCCRERGLIYLPEEMAISEAQSQLDDLNYVSNLKVEVSEKWGKIRSNKNLTSVAIKEDDPVQVQLGKLIIINQYIKENMEQ